MMFRCFSLFLLAAAWLFVPAWAANAADTGTLTISATLHLPRDQGLPLGSIFEIKSPDGTPVAGAGFSHAMNTTHQGNSRVLTFFVRGNDERRIVDLGQPYSPADHFFLLAIGRDLTAIPHYAGLGLPPKRYDPATNSWEPLMLPGHATGAGIASIQMIAGTPLLLRQDGAQLYYRTRLDVDPRWADKTGLDILFARDRLYLHAVDETTSYFYICDWQPGQKSVRSCSEHELGEPTQLYTLFPADDRAGIYVTDRLGNTLHLSRAGLATVRATTGESYQVYAAIRYRDRVLLGQYPSGNLLAMPGHTPIAPAVGHLPCSSQNQRELQSVAIHRGSLIAGVWPWGELWEGVPGRDWRLVRRMFSHPLQPCGEAPHEDVVTGSALDYNALGQRIFSITSWRHGVALATAAKNHASRAAFDLLAPDLSAEYGRVYALESDFELSCEVPGKGRMTLSMRLSSEGMSILKDNRVLCERKVYEAGPFLAASPTITAGSGPWGRFAGRIHNLAVGW
jgi:hypothetical protein